MAPHSWIAWLTFSWLGLLTFACLWLAIDNRGERRARKLAEQAIAALQARLAGQDEQIGHLTRALALLVPADARPTAPHHPIKDWPRPFVPTPEQVATARAAYAETKGGPPVALEGDREAFQGESAEEIRARFEAEAEARSQARAGLPSMATDDEPEDERTRVYSGRQRHPTLLGGLVGAPLERPRSDPSRTAREYVPRKATPSSPTLVSPGAVPSSEPDDGSVIVEAQHEDGRPLSERGTPSPTEPMGLSPEATRRLAQLVAAHEHRTGQRPDDDQLAALTAEAVRETLRK
jgi:hypothetical protein